MGTMRLRRSPSLLFGLKDAAEMERSAMAFLAWARLPSLGIIALEIGDRKVSVGLEYRPPAREPPAPPRKDFASPSATGAEVGLGVLRFGIDVSEDIDFFANTGDRGETSLASLLEPALLS